MHRIAFVVPTKDRPDELRKLLASIAAQTRRPDQLIVVDGSQPDVRHVVDEFSGLRPDYVRVFPPSLSEQRNAGMKQLRPDITLAGYLDDDIVVEPEAIGRMLEFWERAAADMGGAVFNIVNAPQPRWLAAKALLGIDGPHAGRMLASGFPSNLAFQSTDVESDWLFGGATVWRREIIDRYGYDEWFLGTGFMEDVDFSFTVRASWRLALVSGARLAHYNSLARLDREHLLGKWQVVNRMYFVRKHRARGLSPAAAWFTSFGLVALHMGGALLRMDRRYWERGKGNLAGIVSELLGRRERIGGHLK